MSWLCWLRSWSPWPLVFQDLLNWVLLHFSDLETLEFLRVQCQALLSLVQHSSLRQAHLPWWKIHHVPPIMPETTFKKMRIWSWEYHAVGMKVQNHSPSSSFSPVHSLNSNHPSASDKIHSILPPARCPWDSQCLQSFLLSTFLYEPAYFSYCCPDWMVTPRSLPQSPKTCCYTFSQQLVFFLHCPIRIITNLFICAILLSSSLSQ